MNTLHIIFALHDEGRIAIHYNEYTKVVQKRILDELKANYFQSLENSNLFKLQDTGEMAFEELVPEQLNFYEYSLIKIKCEFPIEMIWIENKPLATILPLVHSSIDLNYSQNRLMISSDDFLDETIFDEVINPRKLIELKKKIRNICGWIHIEGHLIEKYIVIDENRDIRLYKEDLPDNSFLFINCCNSIQMNNGNNGIYTNIKIKDSIAKQFAIEFYKHAMGGEYIGEAMMLSISKMWQQNCQVLGYNYFGSWALKFHAPTITGQKYDSQEFTDDLLNINKSEFAEI